MNSQAILNLISDLYSQVVSLSDEVEALRAELAERDAAQRSRGEGD
ncbi:hypothetical protein J4H92_03430 [Leucobacter weissii]|uniref:Uncharacterized protein n=1 Tax=Leucobacter weissii TaxID=1983706 RepID=A0A939SB07_9MICO|nr:hypothetical protein [Leucobacter weissii]MBO1901000.1 hypothetical protein [Leucobacter weissii]